MLIPISQHTTDPKEKKKMENQEHLSTKENQNQQEPLSLALPRLETGIAVQSLFLTNSFPPCFANTIIGESV
jgi:hypothetical protein